MTLCGSLCATPPPPASRGATDPPTHCQMDLQAFAKLAKLRGVERSGLSNEVRLWIRSVRPTSTARHANSALPPQAVFRQLDGDGSNDLSKAEVAGLKELVDQHNAKKAASQNPDEMVTFEEFEQLFQPGGKRRLPHTHPPLPHNRSNISSAIRKLCRDVDVAPTPVALHADEAEPMEREFKADGGLPFIFNRLDVDKDSQLR